MIRNTVSVQYHRNAATSIDDFTRRLCREGVCCAVIFPFGSALTANRWCHLCDHAEYPAVSVRANFSRSPPKRSVGFLCELPLVEAAYLASIVIDLHTTLYIVLGHHHANEEVWIAPIVLLSTRSLGHVSWGKVRRLTEWRNTTGRPECFVVFKVWVSLLCTWPHWKCE
jgi:hypothetical protein